MQFSCGYGLGGILFPQGEYRFLTSSDLLVLLPFLPTHHQLVSIKWDCCSFCARQLQKFIEGFVGHYCLVVDASVPAINVFVCPDWFHEYAPGWFRSNGGCCKLLCPRRFGFCSNVFKCRWNVLSRQKGQGGQLHDKIVDIVLLKVVCSSTLFDVQYKHFPTHLGI